MTTIRECLNLYGDALSQEERDRLLKVAGDPNLIQEVESRIGALGQEQQAIIDLIGRQYDADAVAAGVPTRDATLEQTIDEAVAEGRMEPGTAVLARHLFSLDPDLDARTNLEISEEVRLATPEVLEAAGIPVEDAEQYQVLGETATSVHDGLLKTAIRLYRGHDADTLVEEFYHRFWDHLDQASRDLYQEYHQQSGDERSVHEFFAQEGRDLFFSEKLHEQAGPIREVFGRAREALRALISRIRRIRGAQIPDEIRGLYRAAVEPIGEVAEERELAAAQVRGDVVSYAVDKLDPIRLPLELRTGTADPEEDLTQALRRMHMLEIKHKAYDLVENKDKIWEFYKGETEQELDELSGQIKFVMIEHYEHWLERHDTGRGWMRQMLDPEGDQGYWNRPSEIFTNNEPGFIDMVTWKVDVRQEILDRVNEKFGIEIPETAEGILEELEDYTSGDELTELRQQFEDEEMDQSDLEWELRNRIAEADPEVIPYELEDAREIGELLDMHGYQSEIGQVIQDVMSDEGWLAWRDNWGDELDAAEKRIMEGHERLARAYTISQKMIAINLALQEEHVYGTMADHMDVSEQELSELSEMGDQIKDMRDLIARDYRSFQVKRITAPPAPGTVADVREVTGAEQALTPEHDISLLQDDSPYKTKSYQLVKVPRQVEVGTNRNAPPVERIFRVAIDPKIAAKLEDIPAPTMFSSIAEARAYNLQPWRIEDWNQIYDSIERGYRTQTGKLKWEFLESKKATGKLDALQMVLRLCQGCQRAATTVERVSNGILPNETRLEACYGGVCWVNWTVASNFKQFENMEVQDLLFPSEEQIERFVKNRKELLESIPFIREGYAGDSSHLFPTGLAEHWLKTIQDAGITTPTVFISAGYAPVTDDQYAALLPYNDLFELHFSISGWFHTQENMLRLAEFQAAKEVGLNPSVRIITNASDIAGLQMASEGELLDLMRDMGITQLEILETPFHDDRIPSIKRGKPGVPWRSDPTGLFKYICCETKKCGTCAYKCMTKTDRARGEQPKVSYQVKKLTEQAVRQFGTTNDPREAGFILGDGRMLDFSGKDEGGQPGGRNFEHSAIGDRVDLHDIEMAAFDIMERLPQELAYDPVSWVQPALFGATTGAMRFDYYPMVGAPKGPAGLVQPGRVNTIHLEVFGRPTANQFHRLRKMITRDTKVYVDITEPSTGQTRPGGDFVGEGLQSRWQLREHLEKFWPGFMKQPAGSVQTHWQLRNLGDGPFDPDAQDPTDMVDDWVNLQDISDPIEIDDTSSYEAVVKEARRRALVAYHKKKKTAERKSELEFERQAKSTVEEIPLYVALDDIAKSKTGKLDLEILLRDYDAETVAELRRKKRGLVAKKGVKGVGYDEAAMDAGYETADEFILDILQSPTQKEAVEMEVQDLLEEYSDYMSLEDQDLYMDMLDEEIKILQQLTKKYRPRPSRRIKKTIREQTGLLKVGNLIDEREAMQKMLKRLEQTSREAFREGRKDAALVAKEQARDLRLRQREQNRRRREANKFIGKMRNMGRRKLPLDFREQLRYWLESYGLKMKGRRTHEPAESMQKFLDRQEAEGENVDILRAMMSRLRVPRSEPGKPGYRQLTLNELRDLHDAAAAMVKMGSDREFLISEFKKINFQMTIDEMLDTIYKARPEIPPDLRKPLEILDEDLKWYEGLSEVSKKYFSMLKKAEFIFRALDGHEDFGRVWSETFYRIVKAENEELKLGGELMNMLDEAFAPFVQGWMSGYSWANARHTIRGESTIRNSKGENYVLTKERMIMIALNSGNEGNLAALMEGYNIDEAFVQDVWSALTKEEKQLVKDIWAAIDSLFPKLAGVFMHLNGSRLQKVEGNYFPLVFDRKLSWKADRHQAEAEMRDFFKTIYAHASPAKGFTYGRVGGKMPPKLDFGVIFKHVRDVVHYSTHAPAVRDVGKIINDARFRGAVYETLGEQTWRQMNPWLQEVARPRLEDISHVDRWAGRLRRNATVVMLGLKMSVAAKQILSFTQTIDEIGVAYALRGVYDFYRAPWDTARFIVDNSVPQANRKRKWDRELQAMARGMSPVATGKMGAIMRSDDMRNAFFGLIGGVDKLAVYPTWIGAYHKAMDDHGDHHKAVDYADMVVRRTQPAASPKDLAGWQRGGEIQRLSAMFYTFFAVFQNRMMEVHDKVRIGNIHIGQAMLSYWWIMILPAILGEAINKRRKLSPEEMLKALISYRFAGMPIARDFVGAVTTDYDATFSPAFGVLKAADRFGQQVEKAFTGDPDAYKIFRTGTTLAGYVLGLPSRQAVITIDGALDLVQGETTNPMRLLFPEERKKKTVARR